MTDGHSLASIGHTGGRVEVGLVDGQDVLVGVLEDPFETELREASPAAATEKDEHTDDDDEGHDAPGHGGGEVDEVDA